LRLLRWQSTTQAFQEALGEGEVLTMLRIPAGRFWMGSPDQEAGRDPDEGPQREVEIGEFLIASTPITQAQWRVVAGWKPPPQAEWQSPLPMEPFLFQGEQARLFEPENDTAQRPVESVTWEEAMEFCRRLSQRSGRRYTLPSEPQWEYACRAGTTSPYAFGVALTAELATLRFHTGRLDDPGAIAWDAEGQQTTPVLLHPANAWGLHDMHGNVWEWCLDHWHASYSGAPADGTAWIDPQAPANTDRVVRGGAWSDPPSDARSACRYRLPPQSREPAIVGLRVVCMPGGGGPVVLEAIATGRGGMFTKRQEVELMPLSTGVKHKPLVYVSYAWGSRTPADQASDHSTVIADPERIVGELCIALEQDDQIVVGLDRQLEKVGDSIADSIARSSLIVAVISKRYLRSDWCMKDELLQAFRRRDFDNRDFCEDVLALVLDDALADLEDQSSLTSYWSQRLESKRKQLEMVDPQRKPGLSSWQDFEHLEELLRRLPDLLRVLHMCAMPGGAKAIQEDGFHQIRKLVMRRLQEKRWEVSS
jgi:formylglycine-generating enzyme required for sulfatase activity